MMNNTINYKGVELKGNNAKYLKYMDMVDEYRRSWSLFQKAGIIWHCLVTSGTATPISMRLKITFLNSRQHC